MIKGLLLDDLKKAVKASGFETSDIVLSIPENDQFGDYSTNIPLQLSKLNLEKSYQSPKDIANEIIKNLGHPPYLERVEVAGAGFINFWIKGEYLSKSVQEILAQGSEYGKSDIGKGKKVQVEFISANPTGPLTLANGRGGAIGDALANVLLYLGFDVEREYYLNDTGNQVRTLGEAVKARAGLIKDEDKHYKGEYIEDLTTEFKAKLDLDPQELGHLLADYLVENDIKRQIKRLGIKFDNFFSERSLYPGGIDHALETLKSKNLTYEKEGAVWFKGSEYGDTQDRVLVTSQQNRGRIEPTYFLADVAYHLNVFERGFDKKINVWGADHHDYGFRLRAAIDALGFKDNLDIIFMQFVRLIKDGKEFKMSKRAGTYVTLDELLDLVGVDVTKYFFLMVSPNTHIDFNIDLAKESSSKNPVFYVQYAYARVSSILQKASDIKNSPSGYIELEKSEKKLIKLISEFPDLVVRIGESYEVHHLTQYAYELADSFHKFYENCPVITTEKNVSAQRVALVKAVKITLKQTLDLLGISAPEKM